MAMARLFRITSSLVLLLAALAVLTPIDAEAAGPATIEGVYEFSGEIRSAMLIRKENVYIPSPEGRARVIELKAQGFTCTRSAPQFHVCQKTILNHPLPSEVSDRISRKTEDVGTVVLQTLREPPVLIFDGDVSQEWHVPQAILVGAKTFESHNRLLAQGVEKLKMGDPTSGSGIEFVYDAAKNQIRSMVIIAVSKGLATDEYSAWAIREQK